jgi:hypothetical protein
MIWLYIFAAWLAHGVIGTLVLYYGYGFVMAARYGRDRKDGFASQRKIVWLDSAMAFAAVLWDAWMNFTFYCFICLDFRPHTLVQRKVVKGWNLWLPVLVTGRMDGYGLNPQERGFRRNIAAFIEALTGSKEQRGYHVKGTLPHLNWLN